MCGGAKARAFRRYGLRCSSSEEHAGLGYERQRSGDLYRSSGVTSLPKSPKPGVIGHRRSAEKPLTILLNLHNAHLRRCPRQGDAYATDYSWKGGPARARDVRRGRTAIGVMHYERWQLPCFFPPARRFISKSLGGEALPNPLQRRRMTGISLRVEGSIKAGSRHKSGN